MSPLPAHPKRYRIALAALLAALLADQLCKAWLLELTGYDVRAQIEWLPFFNIVLVWNRGVSFGMLSSHDQPLLLIGLSLLIIAILCRWLQKAQESASAAAIGIIIGGALGNIIDRLRFGAVADFFDFHLYGYHWPAFNIADSCIFIGVVVLCIRSMFGEANR